MSWRLRGEDPLAGCGGVGDGSGAVQLRRVAILQDPKETSRDLYLLNTHATSCCSSHLYCDDIPQLVECETIQFIAMYIVPQEWNGVFLVLDKTRCSCSCMGV